MRCAIWHHLYNLKNVKNTHGGVLILRNPPHIWQLVSLTRKQVPVHGYEISRKKVDNPRFVAIFYK